MQAPKLHANHSKTEQVEIIPVSQHFLPNHALLQRVAKLLTILHTLGAVCIFEVFHP